MRLVFLVFLFILLAGCIGQKIGENQIPVTLIINYSGNAIRFETSVLENSSVLDLLKNKTALTYKEFPGLGVFVESINNISNSQTEYWMFYVDGNLSSTGVSNYLINKKVVIEMRYEEPK